MDINDVIKKFDGYEFKIQVDEDKDVFKKMCDTLKDYCEKVKELDENIANKASLLCEEIIKCFESYYKGDLYKSISCMKNIIKKYESDLYIHDMKYGNSINIYNKVNEWLYKGIVEDWSKTIDRKYMLHIPFSKRKIVKTQRFSIPGVPCLYLGQSLFIIWEELNRPQLNNLFVSRFKLNENTKVLDLGLSISDLSQNEKYISSNKIKISIIDEVIEKFLITNVFKIACLIRVKEENRDFKSEYIIPQLLLVSIIKCNAADGVRYSSVKVNDDAYIYANYAFPAIQKHISNPHEELSDDIISNVELTQPINIGLYNMVDNDKYLDLPENFFRTYAPCHIGDYYKIYKRTYFYKLEQRINSDNILKFSRVNESQKNRDTN